jgi:hypothetical protein
MNLSTVALLLLVNVGLGSVVSANSSPFAAWKPPMPAKGMTAGSHASDSSCEPSESIMEDYMKYCNYDSSASTEDEAKERLAEREKMCTSECLTVITKMGNALAACTEDEEEKKEYQSMSTMYEGVYCLRDGDGKFCIEDFAEEISGNETAKFCKPCVRTMVTNLEKLGEDTTEAEQELAQCPPGSLLGASGAQSMTTSTVQVATLVLGTLFYFAL